MEQLSPHAITNLMTAASIQDYIPTVQVLQVKRVPETQNGQSLTHQPDRYRVILSDGQRLTQAILGTQLNHLAVDGILSRNCLVRLEKVTRNLVQNRNLLILIKLEVISQQNNKLGNPLSFETHGATKEDSIPSNGMASKTPFAASTRAAVSSKSGPAGKATGKSGFQAVSTLRPNAHISPIAELSPYQNKWTMKARITDKSDIRHWSNAKGEGDLFNITMMDETGKIRGTGFTDAVKAFYEKIQEGKVYYISKGRIVPSKKQFNYVGNDYEITFDGKTEFELCADDSDMPALTYNFVSLEQLQELKKDSTCDVLVLVTDVGELGEIVSKKTQKPLSKRELTLADRSGFTCRLTLWGKTAEGFQGDDLPVVAFRELKVGDFGGRSLSYQGPSLMTINPDWDEAHALRGWYDTVGRTQGFRTHTRERSGSGKGTTHEELMTLQDVKLQNLGMGDDPDFFTAKASVTFVMHDTLCYPACRGGNCHKKVTLDESGKQWECGGCGSTCEEPDWRYMVKLCAADHTESAWFNIFNEVGEKLFEMSAGDLQNLKRTDNDAFQKQTKKAMAKVLYFKCKAELNVFNSLNRVRYSVNSVLALDCKREMRTLLNKIRSYLTRTKCF